MPHWGPSVRVHLRFDGSVAHSRSVRGRTPTSGPLREGPSRQGSKRLANDTACNHVPLERSQHAQCLLVAESGSCLPIPPRANDIAHEDDLGGKQRPGPVGPAQWCSSHNGVTNPSAAVTLNTSNRWASAVLGRMKGLAKGLARSTSMPSCSSSAWRAVAPCSNSNSQKPTHAGQQSLRSRRQPRTSMSSVSRSCARRLAEAATTSG